jgi:hypothetical protein
MLPAASSAEPQRNRTDGEADAFPGIGLLPSSCQGTTNPGRWDKARWFTAAFRPSFVDHMNHAERAGESDDS